MALANEDDVVIAFRLAVEEEMRKMQSGAGRHEDVFAEGVTSEVALRRLADRQVELEHEVALLRTIVLRLVSEPVDESLGESAA